MAVPDEKRLLVLDADTPWITSLLQALPAGWTAERCGPKSAGLSLRRWRRAKAAGHVPVPGWTRMFKLSTGLLARQVASRIRGTRPRAVVHTMPWTAGLLKPLADLPHVYRPHDYFGMYAWDQRRIDELESQLIQGSRIVLPISSSQAGDFRARGSNSIQVLPNAVAESFVAQLRGPPPPRPADLPEGRPIVGCIGQITSSYDFNYCASLADAVPNANFVFVGPVQADDAEVGRRLNALRAKRNFAWLGPKLHAEVPNYLRYFDVCWNPLAASAWNDRRSLLRLYDYLAAEKPILSTDVASAREHAPHIAPCATVPAAQQLLQSFLSPGYCFDVAERRRYVDVNTWNVRAAQLVRVVDDCCR